jgi:hypothetical protein
MSKKVLLSYIPHGINTKYFYNFASQTEVVEVDTVMQTEMRARLFGDSNPTFVVLYNNRNVRRKCTSDVILAFKVFYDGLTPKEQKKVRLVMHTQRVDHEHGTDLPRVVEHLAPYLPVVFDDSRLNTPQMNCLYNLSDVVINMASNEGFGLGTLEAMMAERMIVANVTGGLQDQMGFVDEKGNYLHEDIHYSNEWGSNADGKYKEHGEWVVPVYPSNRSLSGSVPTPYIFDDRCDYRDAGKALRTIYDFGPEERLRRGKLGREFALKNQMSAEAMGANFIKGIDTALKEFVPRQRFELVKV